MILPDGEDEFLSSLITLSGGHCKKYVILEIKSKNLPMSGNDMMCLFTRASSASPPRRAGPVTPACPGRGDANYRVVWSGCVRRRCHRKCLCRRSRRATVQPRAGMCGGAAALRRWYRRGQCAARPPGSAGPEGMLRPTWWSTTQGYDAHFIFFKGSEWLGLGMVKREE